MRAGLLAVPAVTVCITTLPTVDPAVLPHACPAVTGQPGCPARRRGSGTGRDALDLSGTTSTPVREALPGQPRQQRRSSGRPGDATDVADAVRRRLTTPPCSEASRLRQSGRAHNRLISTTTDQLPGSPPPRADSALGAPKRRQRRRVADHLRQRRHTGQRMIVRIRNNLYSADPAGVSAQIDLIVCALAD